MRRIRALLDRSQFAAALTAAETLLVEVPENRDVLYMIAVSQRYLGRIPDALATLERFEKIHPDYSRLFQERGHCRVAERAADAAIQAYLRAVNLNPALPASWKALQVLFHMSGQAANADMATAQVTALSNLPVEIVTASSMFADGEIYDAERIVRQYLLAHGNHIEGMRLLAKIGMKLDVLDDAEFLLESVLVLAPEYQGARYDYALALLARHKYVRALEELDKLLEIEPDNRAYRTTYATACVGLGDHERAVQLYGELLTGAPQQADLHLSIAHAQKTLGKQQEAIYSYRAAAASRPSFGDAYWSLANLKTYRFLDEEIERMRTAAASPATTLVDRYHLCFALGKALEDSADYAESFKYYERGNALKKTEIRFRIRTDRAHCSAADLRMHAGILRVSDRLWDTRLLAHFHRRIAKSRIDVARANSRLALESRRDDGAGRYTTSRASPPRPRNQRIDASIPGNTRGTRRGPTQAVRREVHLGHRGLSRQTRGILLHR